MGGPSEKISVSEVKAVIAKMENNKSSWSFCSCFRNVESIEGGWQTCA